MPSQGAIVLFLAITLGLLEYQWQWTSGDHRPGSIIPPKDKDNWIQNRKGLWLYTREWLPSSQPPRAVIFVLHGFGEHCNRYGYHNLAHHLTSAGYAVLSMDHQGLGRSNGDRGFVQHFDDYVDDFILFLNQSKDRWGDLPLVVIGHDIGGGVAIKAALQNEPITALVLSAPLVRPDPDIYTPFVMTVYKMFTWVPRMVIDRREHGRMKRLCRNATALKQYVEDELTLLGVPLITAVQIIEAGLYIEENAPQVQIPTLVLHGSEDLVMKPDGSEQFVDAIGTPPSLKRLITYEEVFHDLFEESVRDQVAEDILQFLDMVLEEQTQDA